MPYQRWQSGSFLQGNSGNYEITVAPIPGPSVISHWWKASNGNWIGPNIIRSEMQYGLPSLVLSTWGNLEIATINDFQLVHFFRNPFGAWIGPYRVSTTRENFGAPALIQSRYGSPGNFEILVPYQTGIKHFWRGPNPDYWQEGALLAQGGNWSGVAFIHSTFFENLEIVATEGASDNLFFIWGFGNDWSYPVQIGRGRGKPGFVQSNFGSVGNFEVVVAWPYPEGGLAHYWRNNNDPNLPWYGPYKFGAGFYDGVSLFQNSFGQLEVAAQKGNIIDFYYREGSPTFEWHGPINRLGPLDLHGTVTLPASTVRIHTTFLLAGDWYLYITPLDNEIYIKASSVDSSLSTAPIYRMNRAGDHWEVILPAAAGSAGRWYFQCHLKGYYFEDGSETGDVSSPIYPYDWFIGDFTISISLDTAGTRYGEWRLLSVISG